MIEKIQRENPIKSNILYWSCHPKCHAQMIFQMKFDAWVSVQRKTFGSYPITTITKDRNIYTYLSILLTYCNRQLPNLSSTCQHIYQHGFIWRVINNYPVVRKKDQTRLSSVGEKLTLKFFCLVFHTQSEHLHQNSLLNHRQRFSRKYISSTTRHNL